MITRRHFIARSAAAALTVPLEVLAQQAQKVFRLGVLSNIDTVREGGLIQGLRELGYIEGRNFAIDRRYVDAASTSAGAADLVAKGVDVIFAPNTNTAQAAKKATATIPIVIAAAPDPVGTGLAVTLSRPGGNVTGLTSIGTELGSKRLQIMRDAFPNVSRAAFIAQGLTGTTPPQYAEVQRAAKAIGAVVTFVKMAGRDEFESALARLREWRADALLVAQSSTNVNNRALIVELAARARLPSMCPDREYAETGALISYGTDFEALYRRAAIYIDKIFKGAKPSDLPIEQPTKFELVVNMKTAKALGLTIPQSLLLRADKVIE